MSDLKTGTCLFRLEFLNDKLTVDPSLRLFLTELYKSKPVDPSLRPLVSAAIDGNVDALRAAWRPSLRALIDRQGRDDTSHPLLHAAHRLNADAVRFLIDECFLSPRQRGTVHPYTSDQLTVAELQAVTPLECVEKMIAHQFSRKSKRRDILLEVQALLVEADAKMKKVDDSALRQTTGNRQLTIDDGLVTPSTSSSWASLSGQEQSSAYSKAIIGAETLRKSDATENESDNMAPLATQSSLIDSPSEIEGPLVIMSHTTEQIVSSPVSSAAETTTTLQPTSLSGQLKQPQPLLDSSPTFPLPGLSASPPLTGGKRPRGGKTGQKLDLSTSTSTPIDHNSLLAKKRAVSDPITKGPIKVAVADTLASEPDMSECFDDDEGETSDKLSAIEHGDWELTISRNALHIVEEMIALSLVQQILPLRMEEILTPTNKYDKSDHLQQPPVVLMVLAPESVIDKGLRAPKIIPEFFLQDGGVPCDIPILTKVYNSSTELMSSAKLAFASGKLREARAVADAKNETRRRAKLMNAPHYGISGHIAASVPTFSSLNFIPSHPLRCPSFVLSAHSALGITDDLAELPVTASELTAASSVLVSSKWETLSATALLSDTTNSPATALVVFLKHQIDYSSCLRSKNVSLQSSATRWGEALPPLSTFLPITVRIIAGRLGLGSADGFPVEEHSKAVGEAVKGHQLMQYATNAMQGAIACLTISGRQRRGPDYAPLAPVPVVIVARRTRTSNETLSSAAQLIHTALVKNASKLAALPTIQDVAEGLVVEVRRQWAHALCAALSRATMPSATGEIFMAKSLLRDPEHSLGCREFALGDETVSSPKFEGLALSFSLSPLHN